MTIPFSGILVGATVADMTINEGPTLIASSPQAPMNDERVAAMAWIFVVMLKTMFMAALSTTKASTATSYAGCIVTVMNGKGAATTMNGKRAVMTTIV